MESSICRPTVPLLACRPRKSVQPGGSADSLIGFRRILSDDIGRLSLRHGRSRHHICRIERVKATGKSSAGGDAGNEEEEEEEDALQATIKKSQKVLAMQNDLLRQIAERKELVSKIRSGILDPEPEDSYEDGNGSSPDVDLAQTSDDAKQNSNGVLSTMGIQSTADMKDFVESAQVGMKDQPLREGSLDVDSDKKLKNGTLNTVLPNEKPTVLSRSSVVPTQQASLAQKSYKPENTTSEVAKSAGVETLSMHSKNDLKDSYTGKILSNVPSLVSKSSASSTPVEEKHEDLRESSAKEIHNGTEDSVNEDLKPPPLAGTDVMNIVLVAAECAPWCKTGGLGDVAGALPKALARRGHRVMVVVPRYGNYAEPQDTGVRKNYAVDGWDVEVGYFQAYIDGVDFVFIDSPMFHHFENNIYGGNRADILKRMVLFCKAAVEVPWHVPCGGVCYGDGNLVFIANDWHTALLPVYLTAYYRNRGLMEYARSVLVIHNIAHQGRGPMDDFSYVDLPPEYADLFRFYDPVGGHHFNIFAAGLKMADRVLTVSHGYSWELKTSEGGWGLHGIINENEWKLRGIVNGIDTNEWNPLLDVHLKSDGYVNYSLETLQTGKPKCKAALQKELGLPVRPDVPLIGFIGRLDYQKGVDLIAEAIPWMMGEDVQVVMLGTGRPDLEQLLRQFEYQHNDKVRGWVGFSVKTSHRITAGADILLMPSRFEPCGLNQLYAMSYGTVPVVHAVGGLRDTVVPFDPYNETGLGWTFDRAEAEQLIHALGNCLLTYRQYKKSWEGLQKRGMMQDLSWDHAAQNYEEVLVAAKYQW